MAHRVLSILRRRLFTFLTILSLLLCLATIALLVRSYWRVDHPEHTISHQQDADVYEVVSNGGELDFSHIHYRFDHSGDVAIDLKAKSKWVKYLQNYVFAGFGYTHFEGWSKLETVPLSRTIHTLHIPHWFLALFFAILPVLHLRSILRTRRHVMRCKLGLCLH